MKLLFTVLMTLALLIDPGSIAKINSLKSEAKKAYNSGDFKTAIAKYKYLVDSLGVQEEEVMMNLSNAYFRSNDTTNALSAYQPLTQSKDTRIKSLANQQLGVLKNRQGKTEEALDYFKQALKAAPDNDNARYNYEMVKKKLEEKKKQDQDKKDQNKDNKDQNKDKKDQDKKEDQKKKEDQQKKDQEKKDKEEQDKKDKENQDKKDKNDKDKKDDKSKEEKDKKEKEEKEKKDKENQDPKKDDKKDKKDIPPSVSDKLKDMQMSEQKAKMILEAMKNQEVQYLQQNKRKATKPRQNTKPDW